jgi:hypothetical protein
MIQKIAAIAVVALSSMGLATMAQAQDQRTLSPEAKAVVEAARPVAQTAKADLKALRDAGASKEELKAAAAAARADIRAATAEQRAALRASLEQQGRTRPERPIRPARPGRG